MVLIPTPDMKIDTRLIPPEGLILEDGEKGDVFALHEDSVRTTSPLRYRLEATLEGSELLLQGWIEAGFELLCVRCLEFFPRTIRIEPFALLEEVEKPGIVDLTDRLREDILLDLPGHPRCNEGDSARECPADGRFDRGSEENAKGADQAEKNDTWAALDDLPEREGAPGAGSTEK